METNIGIKKLPEKEQIKITPHFCPVCGVDTIVVHCIEDVKGNRGIWYVCNCGVIFQDKFSKGIELYDEKYIANLAEGKQAKERYGLLTRLYAPIIEDCTYGRMMLEVGFCVPYILQSMKERGWITWGIDVNPTLTGSGNIYKGDFCNYDFSLTGDAVKSVTGEEKIDRKFDLIWMGHVLEHMEDPVGAIHKAYDLLDQMGCIFIATPDIDFIQHHTVQGWPHFKAKEHYILWSERALCRELERQGFNIIMKRRNFSQRYMSWWDLHLIAQKRFN